MIAIGAGGLDVAVAMGGGTYYITMPHVVGVELTGKLRPFVSAKDIILEVLRRLSVKGGVGKVIEYTGEGIKHLTTQSVQPLRIWVLNWQQLQYSQVMKLPKGSLKRKIELKYL